jgi:hypothetical protein
MSDARVVRGSAPAHEIRDCILRRATEVNDFARGRSCRAAREFAAHNRRRENSGGNEARQLVEPFKLLDMAIWFCLYTRHTRTIALLFNYEFFVKFVLGSFLEKMY